MILNNATNIIAGNVSVDKVYLGNELIWGSSILPDEYRQLPYVRSTGEQYINTLYHFPGTLSDYHFDLKYSWEYLDNNEQGIFGNWTDDGNKAHFTYGVENNRQRVVMYANGGFPNMQDGTPQINTVYDVQFNADYSWPHYLIVNENEYITYSGVWGFLSDEPFYIFVNGPVQRFKSKIKLYYLKFYNGNTLVCHFVPAQRKSDGKVGLYDVVRNQFFTSNSGVDLLPPT